ncbi:AAA ATPase domain-containing protein [Nocardioides alpinus]|uniref:AAA ATPase domain-containing protein n=1 Tax=Nocardioides alpinus TaxID=748909 RepID=A0A1I0VNL4_9ACTN|nr:AAA family ATPase [Nocardioides alpinus]SFA77450.1 AAA ATPase domain-containing protein [Nocardioides alpinus]
MSALPRPDLPPGPARSLNDALHGLHHRAGWPSLRTLARETAVSHTTVSKVFSTPALPSWGTLELLVEALDGDTAAFHALWLAASTSVDGSEPPPRIAGRGTELDVVRRHLESGTGLLLVTGEAGIGKTTVVQAACDSVRRSVTLAAGRCLPLSTEIPLMPFTEALRGLGRRDSGRAMSDALGECPDYVSPALATLLPELGATGELPDPDDRWLRQRLFSAVTELTEVLSRRSAFALVLEDLHWADDLTLDLVDHLFRTSRTRILATWRTDDPDVPSQRRDWCTRVRRDAGVIGLGPLTREETVTQLTVLRPGTSRTAAALIHQRTHGQPLFSAQLAHADAGEPTYLRELLDGRVARMGGSAWRVAAVLGVADRPLPEPTVVRTLEVDPQALASTLRELRDLQLLGVTDAAVHLRHPLLAEAVRRRLLPGERVDLHRALAAVLAEDQEVEPAEIARHWHAAGQKPEERRWRIRAARAAAERFAASQSADDWLRVRELWPPDARAVDDEQADRYEVVVGIANQLDLAGRPAEAIPVLEAELVTSDTYDVAERAHLLALLARFNSSQFHVGERGLELNEQAIELYRSLPPSAGLAAALNWRGTELEWHGRRDEAAAVLDEAARVAAAAGDAPLERSVRAQRAWQMVASGDDTGLVEMEHAIEAFGYGHNLKRDLAVAVRHSDALLMTCGSAAAVDAAARPALELARRWNISSGHVQVLTTNVSQAWRREGCVHRALEVVSDHTADEEPGPFPLLHIERATVDVLRGDAEAARRRLSHLESGRFEVMDPFIVEARGLHEVWTGDPGAGLRALVSALHGRHDEIAPGTVGDLLLLASRAAADMCAAAPADERRDAARTLETFRAGLHHDPFEPSAVLADRAAAPQWAAELGRLHGEDHVDAWLAAIRTWDSLSRPHDAAYCRWRAAQCALRDGQGTVAPRLLKRAARDAHEHVPLSEAIARTAMGHR